jgi:hypothetical protein
MEITLNLVNFKKSNLTPNQGILLYLLYYKKFDEIEELFGKLDAIAIRDSLLSSDFILSGNSKFTETIVSKKHIEKLYGIRTDNINFWEFYNSYPVRVGNRVLRAAGEDTQVAEKHKKKYLARVKTIEAHQKAVAAVEAFVSFQKRANKLNYLPNMETVMNNAMWQQWEVFINESGNEEKEWNTEVI